MKSNLFVAACLAAGGFLVATNADADVKFVRLGVNAAGATDAWDGLDDPADPNSKDKHQRTRHESVAAGGLDRTVSMNSKSGSGRHAAKAADTEEVSGLLLDPSLAFFSFAGTTGASLGDRVSSPSAFAEAGSDGSFAFYRFRLTAGANVSIHYETLGSNESDSAYEIVVFNPRTDKIFEQFNVPSLDTLSDGSFNFSLGKGRYEIFVGEADGTYAPDYVSVTDPGGSVSGFSSAAFVIAIPETSTWIMVTAGFAGLGFLGFRRQSSKYGRARQARPNPFARELQREGVAVDDDDLDFGGRAFLFGGRAFLRPLDGDVGQ